MKDKYGGRAKMPLISRNSDRLTDYFIFRSSS
jgi:hypothetical protein